MIESLNICLGSWDVEGPIVGSWKDELSFGAYSTKQTGSGPRVESCEIGPQISVRLYQLQKLDGKRTDLSELLKSVRAQYTPFRPPPVYAVSTSIEAVSFVTSV